MYSEMSSKNKVACVLKAAAQGIAAIVLSLSLSQPSCSGARADPAPRMQSTAHCTLEDRFSYSPAEIRPEEPEYAWPVPETEQNWNVLSSCYGKRPMPAKDGGIRIGFHNGIDIGIGQGTPVVAIEDGTIVHSCEVAPECNCSTNYEPCKSNCSGKDKSKKSCGGWGTMAIVQHQEEMFAQYLHLQKLAKGIKPGQTVKKGQVIGYSGNTGRSVGAHLHFSIHKDWHIPLRAKDKSKYSIDPLELYSERVDELDMTRHNCGEAYERIARL